MGDVFLRGKRYWCWTRVNGELVRRSTGCADKKAARAVKVRWERENADPAHHAANTATIGEAIDNFLASKRRQAKAPGTLSMYEQKTAHIARLFGDSARLATVTASAVDRYITTREDEGAKPHTVHKELVALRGVLKVAKRRGEFRGDLSEVLPVGYSAQYEPRKTFLTLEQVWTLLAVLPPPQAAQVAYVVATGARRAEMFRARRADVQTHFTKVHGSKTAKSARTNPAVAMYAELLSFALENAPGSAPLFEPWVNARRGILRACKRAGVPAVTWNDLRRTFASLLKQAGASNDVLADLLGHVDTTMVRKVYGHDTPESLKATLERQLGADLSQHPRLKGGSNSPKVRE